jgi:Flp pilus assembly pilin Flp
MVGLIAVVIVAAVTAFGIGVSNLFTIPAGVFGGP